MEELSLHILDIAQNSVSAGAKEIGIFIDESISENFLTITITDNGIGMDETLLEKVTDPFVTSRTTRKVGLGLSLFKMAAELTDGKFEIHSKKGVGTTVKAEFTREHIDRPPLGDIGRTITTLIQGNPQIEFVFKYNFEGREFNLHTAEIKEILCDVPIDSFEVTSWLNEYMNENLLNICEGCF
jgi:anti-sigma regulatory factor (Ser/Thr protein kinase)